MLEVFVAVILPFLDVYPVEFEEFED